MELSLLMNLLEIQIVKTLGWFVQLNWICTTRNYSYFTFKYEDEIYSVEAREFKMTITDPNELSTVYLYQ